MQIPAVIHRWFENGEAWAFHPSLERHLREVQETLDKWVKVSPTANKPIREKMRLCTGEECLLVGEIGPDLHAPDVKAKRGDASPTLLRAAIVSEPDAEKGLFLLEGLRRLNALAPGPNPTLSVETEKPGPNRPFVHRLVPLVCLTAFALAAVAVFLVATQGARIDPAKSGNLYEDLSLVLKLWGSMDKHTTRTPAGKRAVAQAFFHVALAEDVKVELKGNHPDVRFVKDLQANHGAIQKGQGLELENEEGLNKALESLRSSWRVQTPPEKSPLAARYKGIKDKQVREIATLLDYDYWWENQGRTLSGWSPVEKPPESVCNILRRCMMLDSPLATDNIKEMARKMIALLKKWDIDYLTDRDATGRPRFVFHLFFFLLSQEQFEKKSLGLAHPFVVFIKRLPDEPIYSDQKNPDGDSLNKKVRKAWSELATKLDQEAGPNSSSQNLATAIGNAMDYDEWEKEYAGLDKLAQLKDKGKGVPANIERFVQRFQKGIRATR
jgi:hypothetical protein